MFSLLFCFHKNIHISFVYCLSERLVFTLIKAHDIFYSLKISPSTFFLVKILN